jgi:hypothetical protein
VRAERSVGMAMAARMLMMITTVSLPNDKPRRA